MALTPAHPSGSEGERLFSVIRRFISMGIFHILSGPDHILFVLGLILAGGSTRQLCGVVTAFTLAHSLTLSLTALGIASLSPRVVEPVIAFSIVVVGLENLLRRKPLFPLRIGLAFGFGFFHGFGFAGALAEAGLPAHAIGWSLASFNTGVEIGQGFILLVVLPVLFVMRQKNEHGSRLFTQFASVAIALAGAVWFADRLR
jgi:hydrogenase/urease accessory protein HupE